MGRSMCGHLIGAGFKATVYNRTKEKAAELIDRGATWADSPRDVAAASDVVIAIVGFPNDVRHVMLGDDGALAGCKPGNMLVDMTTSEPSLAVEIAKKAKQREVVSIDAPVSGGDVGARNATLSIMIGGDEAAVATLEPIWKVIGQKWIRQGGPGAGQHTKMVNQVLIATGMIGVCEALLYGYKAGLDLERVLESVASGAAGSWSLSNYGPRMIAGNFDPGFFRRALHQGHGHRAGRSAANEAFAAGARACRATVSGGRGAGPWAPGYAFADAGTCESLGHRLAKPAVVWRFCDVCSRVAC